LQNCQGRNFINSELICCNVESTGKQPVIEHFPKSHSNKLRITVGPSLYRSQTSIANCWNQGRNEVRWLPGQEQVWRPHVRNRSFGSKCTEL